MYVFMRAALLDARKFYVGLLGEREDTVNGQLAC